MACLLLSIAPLSTLAQSQVGFAYDAAGNRVKKELNVSPPQKYVGKFEGVNVFESRKLGDIRIGRYSAVTIPERGIIAADGVFTSQMEKGLAMMQHEFGHVLQYREFGSFAYWQIIAPASLVNAAISTSEEHGKFWTETWANHLSKGYFVKNWLGSKYGYPSKNIGNFKTFILGQAKLFQMLRTKPRWFI